MTHRHRLCKKRGDSLTRKSVVLSVLSVSNEYLYCNTSNIENTIIANYMFNVRYFIKCIHEDVNSVVNKVKIDNIGVGGSINDTIMNYCMGFAQHRPCRGNKNFIQETLPKGRKRDRQPRAASRPIMRSI